MRSSLAASLAALALLSLASTVRAQTGFEAGRTVISASLGTGVSGIYGNADMPLVGFTADFGVNDRISVGGFFGVASSTYDYGFDNEALTLGYSIIAARGSYHFGDFFDIDRLDVYSGVSLGYNHVSLKSKSGDAVTGEVAASSIILGAHAGGRYFFTPAVAGFAEVGYGLGNVSAGVSVRF